MEIEEIKKAGSWQELNPGTSSLSCQWSANHQPSQSSIYTAQVLLNASVTHMATIQYVPSFISEQVPSTFYVRKSIPGTCILAFRVRIIYG